MTIEEELDALKAEKTKLADNNKSLTDELKKAREKIRDIDPDSYYKVVDELETVKAENAKLNHTLGLKSKDVEKLSTTLNELESNLKKTTLENALNEHLTKVKVQPELLPAVKALLEKQATVSDNNVLIGEKPINDYMVEWALNEGKAYIAPSGNSGTGASGGQSNGGQHQSLATMSEAERVQLFKTDPIRFNQLIKGN